MYQAKQFRFSTRSGKKNHWVRPTELWFKDYRAFNKVTFEASISTLRSRERNRINAVSRLRVYRL